MKIDSWTTIEIGKKINKIYFNAGFIKNFNQCFLLLDILMVLQYNFSFN